MCVVPFLHPGMSCCGCNFQPVADFVSDSFIDASSLSGLRSRPFRRLFQYLLSCSEGAKVTAQRALHELQLDMQAQVQKYTQLEQARR